MADAISRTDASNVVLIGCHRFTALEDLPAVANNLTSLRDLLADPSVWGVPEDRIEVLAQLPRSDDILDAVERAAASAVDTLVVYYAGHGLIDPLTGELYLALAGSSKGSHRVRSALRFDDLRRAIHSSRAEKKVVLIDCCFSARALVGAMGSSEATDVVDKAVVEGTCVITAASETAEARAEPGEEFTAFTGALLDTLKKGVTGAGELLDMEILYHKIYTELDAASRPLPQKQNRNTAGRICIARNRAHALVPLGHRPNGAGPTLAASQVRIYSATGDLVGSGFLVAADVVCTCAHVITMALGMRHAEPVPSNSWVQLDFPRLRGCPKARASVVSWRRDGEDMALLRLDGVVDDSWPAPLVDAADVWQHPFRVFGFPRYYDDGVWVSGTLRAQQASGWVQMEAQEPGPAIGAGFSGAPVWDETLDGVVGMTVAVHGGEERTAYLAPLADLVQEQTLQQRCPFPGLAAFTEDDAEFFFGRESDTDRLYTAVLNQSVTLVAGPSGCGKSSLVLAGLLPRLRAQGMRVSELRPLPGVPASEALAKALTNTLEPELGEVERLAKSDELTQLLETGGNAPAELRGKVLACGEGPGHIIFVDQLEEYADAEPAAARDLLTLLAALSGQDGVAVLRVVATARPASLELLKTPDAFDLVGDAVQFLAPLPVNDLGRAISASVDAVPGLWFEPGLPERIVADSCNEPGRMPLVQFALTGLWTRRTRSTLTHAAYDFLGGVPGCVVTYADRVLSELAEGQQQCARRLFIQLARPGDGDTFSPRSARAADLAPEIMEVALKLAASRLVVLSPAPGGAVQEEIVDLAHEALIGLWPALGLWLVESRDFRLWQEALRADLNRWEIQHRDPARLLRGADLAEAERRMALDPTDIVADERDYILLSRHLRRRVRLSQAAIGSLAVLTVLAAVLALFV
ncbi:trypsin-like peptidase domain-containing protein [Streptomyces sp. NPDC059701]